MKKITFTLILITLIFSNIGFSYDLKNTNKCYENVWINNKDSVDEGEVINRLKLYTNIVDDKKNGYFYVSGEWPTCGCSCESTSVAFKKENGKYLTITNYVDSCEGTRQWNASENISEVLPKNFSLNSFKVKKYKFPSFKQALYYIDLGLPQHGVVTSLTLKKIPYKTAMDHTCSNGICINVSLNGISRELAELLNMLKEKGIVDNQSIIDFMEEKKLKKNLIEKIVQSSKFDVKVIRNDFKEIYQIYLIDSKLDFDKLDMKFDKKVNRFIIIKKYKKEKSDFLNFLLEYPMTKGFPC